MFDCDPSVDFSAHFNDLWNWGMTFTAPMVWYRSYLSSRFQKSHLQKFPHSTTTERMLRILAGIDAAVDQLSSPSSSSLSPPAAAGGSSSSAPLALIAQTAGKKVFTTKNNTSNGCNPEEQSAMQYNLPRGGLGPAQISTYQLMLRLLSRGGPAAARWLPFVDLNWVQWEMYVKRVCLGVLHFTVKRVLDHRQTITFPYPTPRIHNDLVFVGSDRAPPINLWLRRLFPDLHWALRCGQQPNGLNIRLFAGGTDQRRLSILAQPHIQLLINQLAREQSIAKSAVEQRADAILRGIGDTMNHQQLRTLGLMIRKVFMTLYDRINLNPDAYDILFSAFRRPRCSVIIIPAHRSYIDFLVVSYLLVMMGLPVPHICSGEDFLRLGGIASLMRGSGAFFMRRSFKNDRLYGALFKEYIRHLVRGGECVEFFIEGMRSRTGKTMPPKLGILKFVTDAFFEKQDEIDDVLFVPVGLSYEKLLEGNVYADELMGIPKPKETVSNLLKSATVLKSKYGAMNVHVGEPISLKAFADDPHQAPPGFEKIPETERVVLGSSSSSVSAGGGTYTPIRTLASVAWRITYELQRTIVVTPTSLLAAVAQCTLNAQQFKSSGVPTAVIASNVEWLRAAVLHRGGKMNTQFAVCDGMQLMSLGIQNLQPRVWVSPLSHVFMDSELASTQMLLAIYSNQLLHVFADEAILVLAAFSFGRGGSPAGADATFSLMSSTQAAEVASPGELPQANTDRTLTIGELKSIVKPLRKLLSREVPNFQRPCPISLDSWLSSSLANLYDDNRSIRGTPLSDSLDEDISFVRTQFASFVTQLLYPLIESHWIAMISVIAMAQPSAPGQETETSAASSAATKSTAMIIIDDAQLSKLSHQAALVLHKNKISPFLQSSSKESLKNCVGFLVEEGILAPQPASPQPSYRLRPNPIQQQQQASQQRGLDASLLESQGNKTQGITAATATTTTTTAPVSLDDYLQFVNTLRHRPSSAAQTKDAISIVVEMFSNNGESGKSKM
jgi:glyceronephosphate O-acyltransferase